VREFVALAGGCCARPAGAALACALSALAIAVAAPSAANGDTAAGTAASSVSATASPASAAAPTISGYAPDLPARIELSGHGTATAAAIDRKSLRKRLRELTRRAGSGAGVWVADLAKGNRETLFSYKEKRRRILASNEKLFTTAAALDRLGAESRITTALYRKGAITDGRLNGGIYLVGAGDPALSSRRFATRHGLPHTSMRKLAKRVSKAGIRRITGTLRADDSVFDRRRGVPDSNWRYSPFIGGRLSGLSYNGAQSKGEPARVAATALRKALRKEGVTVKGGIGLGTASKSVRKRDPLAEVRSPALSKLVAATNKPSNNFFAEMLLKRTWAKAGRQGTTPGGAKAVQRFARREGSGVHAVDGSGLTRTNRASPREVGRLLAAMRKHEAGEEFEASLAIAGRDGTLGGRMQGTRAAGRCRGKTGTLIGVSTLSGYCDSGDDVVAFSILMNGTDPTKARKLQDRMTIAIARYRD
jgi:D-alanyl-D-alanine carboxypeptidase/D-alanyl-D-alanine-endopeptidase (penicillin-binding protein 4)